MIPRFPPYVRFILGEHIQLVSQEGTVAEAITPDQAVFLASQLLQASIIARQGEQPCSASPSHPS